MMQKRDSLIAFWASLIIHLSLFGLLGWAVLSNAKTNDSANGFNADVISTNISMEMMMATVVEEPEPVVEPTPEPEPEVKQEIPDPTVKPEPPKPEPPKPKEQPKKEKPKPKPEKTKREKPKRYLPKADREVNSNVAVNSLATTTGQVTTNNPNLMGNGRNTDEASTYRSALRREIERHKRYPQRAKMMRRQGVVTISFNIAANGNITDARITKSSGNDDLDNSALSAVKNARAIGPRPAGMAANISVPISFRIQ